MNRIQLGRVFQTSLVIFAMLFGAGNLMFPLKVGLLSGDKAFWGIAGFLLTGVLLPLLGLLSIIAFDGDYNAFFGRVGKIPGALLVFFCMITLGPAIIMPRIVTLSYEMLQPFLPSMPVAFFASIFLSLVFVATYKQGRLLSLIGNFLSPLKVGSLLVIIIAGIFTGVSPESVNKSIFDLFKIGIHYGYGTLDLLGTIFFGSIVVKLLTMDKSAHLGVRQRIKVAGFASIGAGLLLGLVYIGMGALGAFHGYGLGHLNEGQLFSTISFRVLGTYGAALIGFTVFLACFTTAVALTAVVADYIHITLFKSRVKYAQVLAAILALCLIPASFGLSAILSFSMPFIEFMYPVLIMIASCNALYKLTGFNVIKLPVLATVVFMTVKYLL